ncbi:hypothetical protein [Crenobacter intestini]|uniref:Uncharacterized protein n=1 Tax=Crenobacter intestini TaxID=2563443 RepID=A0A4T0V1C9_9NEIS|nr:hypothetical protein [Crenobacter intestini]TIC85362.1 hypothetical protein E5K04_05115 [Crenobacter intestini]
MMTPPQTQAVTVLPLGMDERKLAVLRMAFRMHQAIRYQLAEAAGDTPALAIVDVDNPQGWQVWDELRGAHPALPALVVSAYPQPDAPAPLLAKPIRVETLFPALQQLLTKPAVPAMPPRAAEPAAVLPPVPPPATRPAPQAPAASDAGLTRSAIERAQQVRPAREWPDRVESFDPTAGLYGVLTSLYRQRRAAAVFVDAQEVLRLYPAEERCVCCVAPDTLARLCAAPTPAIKLRALQGAHEHPPVDAPTAQSVLWQLALKSARGRMPEGVGADSLIRLRHWPNLTRLAPLPDAMRMAAFWTRTPASPRMALRMLGVEVADLCNFIAACHAIGLIDTRRASPQTATAAAQVAPAPAAAAPRGLLSRLLARLRGQ